MRLSDVAAAVLSGHPAGMVGLAVSICLVGCRTEDRAVAPPARAVPQSIAPLTSAPVPKLRLAERGPLLTTREVYRKDYVFSDDWFTRKLPIFRKALEPYKGKPGLSYLEVGAYEGRSLLWMLENILTDPGATATAIDPLEGDVERVYTANLRKSGQQRKVRTIVGYSQVELRRLSVDSYDIVYIDGSHTSEDVLEDAVLGWRLVKPGGLLMFDDYEWPGGDPPLPLRERPRPALDVFYAFYGSRLEIVHSDYELIFRRK
jgi:hypothetical protein